MVNLRGVVLAAIAGMLVATAAAAQQVQRPAWRVGDAWTFRTTTTYADQSKPDVVRHSRQSVVSATREAIELLSTDDAGGRAVASTWTWTADGEVVSRRSPGQAVQYFKPPIRFHQWPSQPGQRWSSSFDTVLADGKRVDSLALEFHVVGWEPVTVPAGTFRALKTVGRSQRPNTAYTSEAESWFAPEAGRRVKLVEKNYLDGRLVTTLVNELVEFRLAR